MEATGATRIEFSGPLEAQKAEQELAKQGSSYRTRIVRTKQHGLRYLVEVFL